MIRTRHAGGLGLIRLRDGDDLGVLQLSDAREPAGKVREPVAQVAAEAMYATCFIGGIIGST
jgi:hypothetical protein